MNAMNGAGVGEGGACTLGMNWVRHRCQDAPVNTVALASFSP